jgi:tungstate transport system ATP-binding protein
MLHVNDLKVDKRGATICHVPQLVARRGERIAVIGPNGSGKTTLLRVIGGLQTEFSGRCAAKTPMRRRIYVHQSPYLFRGSVLANTMYGLSSRRQSRRRKMEIAKQWLDTLGVAELANREGRTLSGGERRRVALARAFATGADLLLLDEPLADLDETGIELVGRAISAAADATILITSPVPLAGEIDARVHQLESPRGGSGKRQRLSTE